MVIEVLRYKHNLSDDEVVKMALLHLNKWAENISEEAFTRRIGELK